MFRPGSGSLPAQQSGGVVADPGRGDTERRADAGEIQFEVISGFRDDEILPRDVDALARESRRIVREAGLARQHDAQPVFDKQDSGAAKRCFFTGTERAPYHKATVADLCLSSDCLCSRLQSEPKVKPLSRGDAQLGRKPPG